MTMSSTKSSGRGRSALMPTAQSGRSLPTVAEVRFDRIMDGKGEDAVAVERIKIKLHDKRAALVSLGQHLGMFVASHKHEGGDGGPIIHEHRSAVLAEISRLISAGRGGTTGGEAECEEQVKELRYGWREVRARPEQAAVKAHAANRAVADQFAANVLPIVRAIQASGLRTLREIAAALNARGVRTARGGQWHSSTVHNLLSRSANRGP
jgi:hypothetical protein